MRASGECREGTEVHAHKQFTFLGYTFRPRGAKNRYGKLFDSFLPAVSLDATKKIGAPMAEPPVGRWEPYDGRLSRTVLKRGWG
jgi:hypothetical protein